MRPAPAHPCLPLSWGLGGHAWTHTQNHEWTDTHSELQPLLTTTTKLLFLGWELGPGRDQCGHGPFQAGAWPGEQQIKKQA